MEDTESTACRRAAAARCSVTVGSIRWRILKGAMSSMDTTRMASYSGLDPMEDTERNSLSSSRTRLNSVTVGSIRWRILKDHVVVMATPFLTGLQWA